VDSPIALGADGPDLMTDPRSIVISANPKSGARSGLESAHALRARLESAGFSAELFTDIEAMAHRSRQLHEQGSLRAVVAAGGDGTASLVLGVIPHDVPLMLYPLGSENLLAKYFGIDLDLDSAVAVIERLDTMPVDLFEANGKLLLIMASVGFDAEVVRLVHRQRTSHVTRWSYRWSILSALWGYGWPRFRIATRDPAGGWQDRGIVNWLFAFNVPKYAAGISILDAARCDDGLLDVGAFRGGRLGRGLWHYGLVARGAHRSASSWTEWRTTGLRVESAYPKAQADCRLQGSYQLDGDWGGALPLEINSLGRTASILVPRASREGSGNAVRSAKHCE
jgi:diacylglycerol kinase (ATP)